RAFAPVTTAMRHEKLAVFVVVETPRIAAAVRKDLEFVPHWMIAPHPGAQFRALRRLHAGRPDARGVEPAWDGVEPAVRSPQKAIQRLVRVLVTEAVEQHLGRAIGNVVMIAIRNEEEFRSRSHPDFFFSSRRRHTRLVSDWSSDECSSDLSITLRPGDARRRVMLSARSIVQATFRGMGKHRIGKCALCFLAHNPRG